MWRLQAWLLIVAAIAPSFMAGSSVYHCRVTGNAMLVCGCATTAPVPQAQAAGVTAPQEQRRRACCDRCQGTAEPSIGHASTDVDTRPGSLEASALEVSQCSCCDAYRLSLDGLRDAPPQLSFEADLVVRELPYSAAPATVAVQQAPPTSRASPAREGPPLFLVFSSYRC